MTEQERPEGWPCLLSDEVAQLLLSRAVSPALFSAIIALTVVINETRGDAPGHTASDKWPELRRVALGADGSLGVAEYVVVAYADEPHSVLTRVQPF
ncbi:MULTISPECIES: hypothetical protein [Streptomyces]|uniref:Uncharacterized protein n=3 Tax=Streptomyces TaxID=1883 RepID=A0A3Q9FU70_STRLT|nr:hypothetical protein [Streptomyces luteoverticillatus]AZQ71917.1 hypothetical protein EKH77_12480 [Streptomyces luteoverticillatus]